MTEKLYYTDAYMKNFRARVLSCEEKDGVWHTVLDRSAFYPGGGGQPSDTGTVGAARLISAARWIARSISTRGFAGCRITPGSIFCRGFSPGFTAR